MFESIIPCAPRSRLSAVLLLSAVAAGFALLIPGKASARELSFIAAAVPRQAGIFSAEGPDRTYDRKSIFDYIDGGAEIYLAYDFRECLSRRYAAPGEPGIVLDLFDMGSAAEAFGIFTHDRDGKPEEIGQEASSRDGWIRFWKGRFFVSVYAERETPAALEGAFRLARAVEAGIKEAGNSPPILGKLPRNGLQPGGVRYFHTHVMLEIHAGISGNNVLGLGADTDALLASYVREKNRARLLLVSYPDESRAAAARDRYRSLRSPGGAPAEAIVSENGKWHGCAQAGRLLAVVLDAGTRPLAEALLKEATSQP